MYLVVRRYLVDTALEAELTRRIDEEIVPQMRLVPGFIAYYWARSEEGEMFSVSMFRDLEGSEEANTIAVDFMAANVADLPIERVETIMGEVLLP